MLDRLTAVSRETIDYLDHLARESARFAEVLHGVPAGRAVPTCPDWNAEDLLWHLGEVQWFWATVVRDGLTGDEVEKSTPARPAARADVEAFFGQSSRELQRVLTQTPPQTPAWSWSVEQTAGFSRRRQAHEALIHRVDAELVAENRTPMDAAFSADGIDEVLRIMYGGLPAWGHFEPQPLRTVRIWATDTDDAWLITLGRFSGTDPDGGKSYDEPDIAIADADPGDESAMTVSGRAEDLDCWLWHRPPLEPLRHSGDQDVLTAFEATIAAGIN
jgi:uncharacterized protein (TIGR03083 family)